MDCQQAQQHLEAFLDSRVSADELDRLQTHLSGCGNCRAVFNRAGQRQRVLVESLRAIQMPATVWERMSHAIKAAEFRSGRPWPTPVRPPEPQMLARWVPWMLTLGGLTVVVLLAVTLLMRTPPSTGPDPTRLAAVAEAEQLAHRHGLLPRSLAWTRREQDRNPEFDTQLEQFLPAGDGQRRRLVLPETAVGVSRVHHEVLGLAGQSVLHIAFNCRGDAVSLFIIPDFAGALDMVGQIGRQAVENRQSFTVRRAGRTWLVAVGDNLHDTEYLLDGFQPAIPRQPSVGLTGRSTS